MANNKVELDRLYLGDCLDLLATIPDESIDLIVSSPPYNIGKEYESRSPLNVYLEAQKKVLVECHRVLKKTGSIFWQVGSYSYKGTLVPLDVKFFPIFEELGMLPINRIVWLRQHGLQAKNKFSCRHETVLWFAKSMDYKFSLEEIRVPQKYQNKKHHKGEKKGELSCNPDGKNPGDVWAFRNVKHNHEEQTIHPCQFPEDFVNRVILSTTIEGDTVLDPYMGTGTVPVVAKNTKRHFYGADLDEKYYGVANRRLSGKPNKEGYFPNLKSLRDYIEITGEPASKYRFDLQKGKVASDRSKSKIFDEEHHLNEFYSRIGYEEEAFSCRVKGLEIPRDPKLNGNGKQTPSKSTIPDLFDEGG
ncbi:MAG: site-specific DNA-methyltransferase [Proteobacteria bacterium]|nr:MAG: site-specific DNA-methyltransferase [Pseudomonadota bacterium]